jgi:hypothetical protein
LRFIRRAQELGSKQNCRVSKALAGVEIVLKSAQLAAQAAGGPGG